jgi:WD40 repeat protein
LGERRADLALHAAGIAETAARRAKTLDLALAAQNLMADLQRRRDEAKTLSAAADRLKTNPADGEANLVVGEDFCFRQRRWDLGLPLIARGNDPVLKALAERDLASPSQQGDEIALGNDWWDLGRKQIGAKKSHFLARGYLYLKRALPQAQDLQRLAIEKRLAEAPFVGEAPGEAARFTRNSGGIWAVQFTPDGRYALSAGEDCMIRMWDILTGREIRRFEGHTSAIMRLSVALTGHLFVSGSHDHTARVWDLDSGHEVHRFEYGNDVNAAVISPDGKLALIADNMSAQRLFDSATGKPAANFAGEGSYASAWSSGGRCFASGGWDRFANVFDAHTLKQLYHLPQGDNQVYALALSVDGRRLLSSGPNRIIRFWDLDHGTEIRSFEGSAGSIRDLAISPDNRYALAAGAESQLRVWDLFAGGPAREFEGHTDAIHGVCFSPDGRLALTGSADGTARVWRLPDPN